MSEFIKIFREKYDHNTGEVISREEIETFDLLSAYKKIEALTYRVDTLELLHKGHLHEHNVADTGLLLSKEDIIKLPLEDG